RPHSQGRETGGSASGAADAAGAGDQSRRRQGARPRSSSHAARPRRRGDRVIRRREFITLVGGAAAWPLAAHAQQAEQMRHIGVLTPGAADDPVVQQRNAAFLQALQQLGWTVGRNLRIDYRWPRGDAERIRKYAAELVALAPDVIFASGTSNVGPLLQATR